MEYVMTKQDWAKVDEVLGEWDVRYMNDADDLGAAVQEALLALGIDTDSCWDEDDDEDEWDEDEDEDDCGDTITSETADHLLQFATAMFCWMTGADEDDVDEDFVKASREFAQTAFLHYCDAANITEVSEEDEDD